MVEACGDAARTKWVIVIRVGSQRERAPSRGDLNGHPSTLVSRGGSRNMEPGEGTVKILGFKLFYRTYGTPAKGTFLCPHGGPGVTHDYLLPPEDLAQFGDPVVLMEQLGCGKSERPR